MIVKTSPINRLQLYLELRQLVDRVRVVAAGALPQLLLHVEQLGAAGGHQLVLVARVLACASASKSSIRRFAITEKAPTRAFSWLKAPTSAFTFKTLLRHYAKQALTPRYLNVKLGLRCKGHREGPSP